MSVFKARKHKKPAAVLLSFIMIMSLCMTVYADVKKNSLSNMAAGASPSGYTYSNAKICVSKIRKVLTLYEGGKITGEWPCNIGTYSGEGDKKQEGDSTTPSGNFYVCTRNDKSVCYLALGISYPSADDAERGLKSGLISSDQYNAIKTAIRNHRQPLWDTALGGEVEIHGYYTEGGTTHGCVAVENSVMDILWAKCPMGTPIQIGP